MLLISRRKRKKGEHKKGRERKGCVTTRVFLLKQKKKGKRRGEGRKPDVHTKNFYGQVEKERGGKEYGREVQKREKKKKNISAHCLPGKTGEKKRGGHQPQGKRGRKKGGRIPPHHNTISPSGPIRRKGKKNGIKKGGKF